VIRALEFDSQLASSLPSTHTLLKSANLVLHPAVSRVILHGSRGLAGGYRPDSDIDLSLIVDAPKGIPLSRFQLLLRDVADTTLNNWKSRIEADLAVVFDIRNCGLMCFERTVWDERLCVLGGRDCFGLFKIQRGFDGLVTDAGVEVKRMVPCLKIWERA
jgi:predicted nucleotidyltransferase